MLDLSAEPSLAQSLLDTRLLAAPGMERLEMFPKALPMQIPR